MKNAILVLLFTVAVGCSSSSDGGATDGGTKSDSGTGSTDACSIECERQVAAGCSKTPSGYLDACKTICGAGRTVIKADCLPKFDAIYGCLASKATYSCDDKGNIKVNPSDACGAEAIACMTCNDNKICSAVSPGG